MKDKILEILRRSDDYVSGENIGRELGVSRTAIWKWLEKLEKDGFVIDGKSNKGYKLIECPDKLYPYEVDSQINTKWLGRQYFYYDQVFSTNDTIREKAEDGGCHGLIVLSEEQTGGRGRKLRPWYTPKGVGLWFSMLLRPNIHPSTSYMTTLVAAIGVVRGVRKFLGIDLGIKWPNDIFYENKKLVGILTEMRGDMDTVHYIVVGCGINVNQESFPDELDDIATSLMRITGQKVDRLKLFAAVLLSLEDVFDQFFKEGFAVFRQEWEDNSIVINKPVRIESFNDTFTGLATGISDSGHLIVKKDDGEIVTVMVGDCSLRVI